MNPLSWPVGARVNAVKVNVCFNCIREPVPQDFAYSRVNRESGSVRNLGESFSVMPMAGQDLSFLKGKEELLRGLFTDGPFQSHGTWISIDDLNYLRYPVGWRTRRTWGYG